MASLMEWFERNSQALQGVAALLAILGGIVAAVTLLPPLFRSDLLLLVEHQQSTLPPALLYWTQDLAKRVENLPPPREEPVKMAIVEIQQLGDSPMGRSISGLTPEHVGFLRLEVRNRSDKTISNARIQIDEIDEILDLTVDGPFMTNEETQAFLKQVKVSQTQRRLVLPPLPPLPPNSSFKLTIYGASLASTAKLTSQEASSSTLDVVALEGTWAVRFYKSADQWTWIFTIILLTLLITQTYILVRSIRQF